MRPSSPLSIFMRIRAISLPAPACHAQATHTLWLLLFLSACGTNRAAPAPACETQDCVSAPSDQSYGTAFQMLTWIGFALSSVSTSKAEKEQQARTTASFTLTIRPPDGTAVITSNPDDIALDEGVYTDLTPTSIFILARDRDGNIITELTTDHPSLQVSQQQIFIKPNTELDHETAPFIAMRVTATSPTSNANPNPLTADLRIAIRDLNDTPPLFISPLAARIFENIGTGQMVYQAEARPDIEGAQITYSLDDDAGGAFTIDRHTGAVRLQSNPDFETTAQYNFTIRATIGTQTATQIVTLNIIDADDPPIIHLSRTHLTLDEHTDTSTAIELARISFTDEDNLALFQHNTPLIDDHPLFAIVGNRLLLKQDAVLDYEDSAYPDPTRHIITITEAGGATQNFTLTLNDRLEFPQILGFSQSEDHIRANDPTAYKLADIIITGADGGNLVMQAIDNQGMALTGARKTRAENLVEIRQGDELWLTASLSERAAADRAEGIYYFQIYWDAAGETLIGTPPPPQIFKLIMTRPLDVPAQAQSEFFTGLARHSDDHVTYSASPAPIAVHFYALTAFAEGAVLDNTVTVAATDRYIIMRADGSLSGMRDLIDGDFALLARLDGVTGAITQQAHYDGTDFFTSPPATPLIHNFALSQPASTSLLAATHMQGLGIATDATSTVSFAAGDSFSSIEAISGSPFDDLFHGDSTANIFNGGAGDDMFWGRGGDDIVHGGAGSDKGFFDYSLASADLTLDARDGVVKYHQLADGQWQQGNAGDHIYNRFAVDFDKDGVMDETDYFTALEDFSIKTGSGDDHLTGSTGADILDGGAGRDMLTGGAGRDLFIITQPAATLMQADHITDFTAAQDQLHVGAFTHIWVAATQGDTTLYAGDDSAHNAHQILAILDDYTTPLTDLDFAPDFNSSVIVHEIA